MFIILFVFGYLVLTHFDVRFFYIFAAKYDVVFNIVQMKYRYVDAVVIVLGALFLMALDLAGILETSAKFMLIPFMIFYFSGKYIGKRIQ